MCVCVFGSVNCSLPVFGSADGERSVHIRAAALQSRPGQPRQRRLRHRKGQTPSAQGQIIITDTRTQNLLLELD